MGFRRNPQQSEDIAKDPGAFITDCLFFATASQYPLTAFLRLQRKWIPLIS